MSQTFNVHEILRIINHGDNRELDQVVTYLYRNFRAKVASQVFMERGTYEDGKDIFEETLITFLENCRTGTFTARSHRELEVYIKKIAHNKWLKHCESKNRRIEREQKYTKLSDGKDASTPLAIMVDDEDKNKAITIFKKLDEICQKILIAFYIDGLSLDEIAQKYELGTAEAVKLRKFRCVKKLRELLLQ